MTSNPGHTVKLPSTSPPRRRRTGLIVLLVAGGLLVLGVGGAVAFGISTANNLRHDTVSESVADVREIVVEVDDGFVTLRAGGGPNVEVRTTRSWTQDEPVLQRRLEGGVLTLTSDCPTFNLGCEVEREIAVPAGTIVRARSVDGTIQAIDLDTPQFTATTVDGLVTASFSRLPQQVNVQTVDGAVRVIVPQGGYRVATTTVSGRTQVDVMRDPAAQREISARTVDGSIEILPG